ncbi:MAG: PleD family two-component system response regulator [Puniceicoccaceae bacterium]
MKEGKFVILHIEDDPDYLDSMRLIIEKGGHQFIGAKTAEKGIRLFREHKPDLIIVDMMMEEVDSGVNIVKELKLAGNEAPIFMLSSVGDQLHATTSYAELGLSGVFQKPIVPEVILRTIDDMMKV